MNSLGKSMRDGNIGRKDPGEINAGKILNFSDWLTGTIIAKI